MKTLLLCLFLTSFTAFSFEIKVSQMSKEADMDRSYVLATQLLPKVFLDCQSFIQGLRIGEFEHASYFIMDPNECDSLHERTSESLRNNMNHCIVVEDDVRNDFPCSGTQD